MHHEVTPSQHEINLSPLDPLSAADRTVLFTYVAHRVAFENDLSQTAKHFIGGILKYARDTSIIMAATYNSYKAYIPGKEAPIVRGWGYKNRSSMIRVPYSIEPKEKRFEIRHDFEF